MRNGPAGEDSLLEELQLAIFYVKSLPLLTEEGRVHFMDDEPDEEVAMEIARRLVEHEPAEYRLNFVRGVVEARDPSGTQSVEQLRSQVIEEFSNSSLSGKYPKDPPVRGPYGEAEILLKLDARPVSIPPIN